MNKDQHLIYEAYLNEQHVDTDPILDQQIQDTILKAKEKRIDITRPEVQQKLAFMVRRNLPDRIQIKYTEESILNTIRNIIKLVDEDMGPIAATGTGPGGGTILTVSKTKKHYLPSRRS